MTFDALVLAGGSATRLGGSDKATIEIGGKTLLERALEAVTGAAKVVVIGPEREIAADVVWAMEEPPGTGPAAGIGAGLRLVDSELVVVLAVDMPLVSSEHITRLLTVVDGHDGAAFVDGGGRPQHLAAVYRTDALRRAARRDLRSASVASLVDPLDVASIVDDEVAMDCDTPDDLAGLRDYLSSR